VIVLFIPITGLGCSRHHGRRKVFPLGRIAWRDDKNLSHMFVTGILRERMLLLKKLVRNMVSTEYDYIYIYTLSHVN
jgi:hypothetical protein